jgi:RecT family protein
MRAHDIRAAQQINAIARERMATRGALMNELAEPGAAIFSLMPRTFEEAMEFAKLIAETDFVPKDFKGKPGNILVAVQMGAEIGLFPVQALQTISVINGRPVVWGDGLWALINNHPLCEWTKEEFDDASMTATCTVKRKHREPVVRKFSKADAEKARLWSKEGPWQQYPKRMLQMRARGFACRDAIPEAFKGLAMREEVEGIERDMGDAQVVEQPLKALETALPANTQELVDKDTGEVQPDEHKRITDGALGVVRGRLAAKQHIFEAFCAQFGVSDPSELTQDQVNPAIDWIKQQ